MIKKLILACLVAGSMAGQSAFAVSTVKFSDGPGNTGGGEFNAVTTDNGNFPTFCLEYNEHIQMGVTYYYQVSTAAKYNGNGTTDPISLATAWLYNEFLNGTLSGYTHNTSSANTLQRAIWFLEGEAGGVGQTTANNSFLNAALSTLGAIAMNDANGAYGVHVMNLWANYNSSTGVYSGAKQDQLIRVPDGGTTLALLGMSMGFVAFASRRMRR